MSLGTSNCAPILFSKWRLIQTNTTNLTTPHVTPMIDTSQMLREGLSKVVAFGDALHTLCLVSCSLSQGLRLGYASAGSSHKRPCRISGGLRAGIYGGIDVGICVVIGVGVGLAGVEVGGSCCCKGKGVEEECKDA